MLAARKSYGIAASELVAVPEVENDAVCLLVMRLPGRPRFAITALNFGTSPVEETLDLTVIRERPLENLPGRRAINAINGKEDSRVSDRARLTIRLDAVSGKTLVIGD